MSVVARLPIDDLAAAVVAVVPKLIERIPASPARVLGRLAAPDDTDAPSRGNRWPHHRLEGEAECLTALRELGPLPVERLLGALELTIAELDGSGVPDLLAGLPQPSQAQYALMATGGHDSEAVSAARLMDQLRPGVADRTVALARALAMHPALTPALTVPRSATDEPAIAARHGAAHLALAVAVADAVVRQASPPVIVERAAATVGLGVGAAVLLLRETPMPQVYAAALLAKVRAEYLLPQHSFGSVTVAGHRFGLTEHSFPEQDDFTGNGLVTVAEGGLVIRAGVEHGHVGSELVVLAQAPDDVESGWEEIVEVSWCAGKGGASLSAPDGTVNGRHGRRSRTPPWPGEYRVRIHARGRDELDAEFERYKIVVWAAPSASDLVHQRTDRLGHRLRGQPEPVRPSRPEHAYRWVRRSPIAVAVTITVVTGATVEQTLRAFGADPARPEPLHDIGQGRSQRGTVEAWVSVLDVGGAVLVVEDNGFRGTDQAVLSAASSGGRAAGMFWNVNAVTRLSFAEGGQVLASFEPSEGHQHLPPAVNDALTGLDFAEYDERIGKGLVAVERFTGYGITAADLTSIRDVGVGYRVVG
jgi:hypothetical protein